MSSDYEQAARISPYLTGWVRVLPERGDVAAFGRGDFVIHLHGSRKVRLTGRGVDLDLRFYDVAVTVAELSARPLPS